MIPDKIFYAALEKMDLSYFKERNPHVDEDVMIIGLHKCRYDCTLISKNARLESAEWLRAKGYQGMYGIPLVPAGQLPL